MLTKEGELLLQPSIFLYQESTRWYYGMYKEPMKPVIEKQEDKNDH